MLKNKNKQLLVSVFIAAIAIFSCQKYQNDLATSDLSSSLTGAVSEIEATQIYESGIVDVQSLAVEKFDGSSSAFTVDGFNASKGYGLGFGHIGSLKFGIPHIDSCATVTVSSSTYPKTITIDYGTSCSNRKGRVKSGKIIIEISDTTVNAGAVRIITYDNFYIDSMKVDLSATFKNLGKNDAGNWVIESSWDQTITKTNGDVIVQKSSESVEWVSGFETTEKLDDVYYKSGSGSVTVNSTLKFSKTITSPLLVDKSCGYIKSGTEELNRNGNVVVIDYGDGTCDDSATVTANDTTEVISLHKGQFDKKGRFHNVSHGFGKH